MLVNQPFNFRCYISAAQVLENHLLPTTLPWILISMNLQSKILFHFVKPSPELVSDFYMSIIFNYLSISGIVFYLLYEILKRRSTTVLYGLETESIIRVLEYPLIFTFNMFTMAVPSFVIAGFGSLLEGREYVVADKFMSKKSI